MNHVVAARRARMGFGVGALALSCAVGGGLWMWWRRRRSATLGSAASVAVVEGEAASDGVGIALPSWVTGSEPAQSAFDVGRASLAQINRARKHVPLASPDQAEDRQLFPAGARASAGPAYFHTAYWLAVGSRLVGGDAGLLKLAKQNQEWGARWAATPGASLRTGNVPDIYRIASTALASRAQTDKRLRAVAAELTFTPSQIERAQAQDRETNPLVAAPRAARGLVNTATLPVRVAYGLVTGDRPDEIGPVAWWALKWGGRVTVAALVLLALRVAFAPEVGVATAVVRPLGRKAADWWVGRKPAGLGQPQRGADGSGSAIASEIHRWLA